MKDLFHQADWIGGNLEGAVGDDSACIKAGSTCFAIPRDEVSLLKQAGFSALTTENNHSGDLGGIGRKGTFEALKNAGIEAIDFEHSPRFVKIGDKTASIVAITLIVAADRRVQALPSDEVAAKLLEATEGSQIVIVSIHWGTEYLPWPEKAQRQAAQWLVDHGADLVVGHHPHVVQPAECIQGKPVFFSLGNHLFDQVDPRTKEGMIADCTIFNNKLRCQTILTHTRAGSSFPSPNAEASPLSSCAPAIR